MGGQGGRARSYCEFTLTHLSPDQTSYLPLARDIWAGVSTSTSYRPSTLPNPTTHTYPPVAGEDGLVPVEEEDDPPFERLLCLPAPREAILLPCRQLVACKDRALNVVEFSACRNITEATDPVAAGGRSRRQRRCGRERGNGQHTYPLFSITSLRLSPTLPLSYASRRRRYPALTCKQG